MESESNFRDIGGCELMRESLDIQIPNTIGNSIFLSNKQSNSSRMCVQDPLERQSIYMWSYIDVNVSIIDAYLSSYLVKKSSFP